MAIYEREGFLLKFAKRSGNLEEIDLSWMEELKRQIEEHPDKDKIKSITNDLWKCPFIV